jgi:hypothetical protein
LQPCSCSWQFWLPSTWVYRPGNLGKEFGMTQFSLLQETISAHNKAEHPSGVLWNF